MKLIYLANISLPEDWAHGFQIMKMCESLADQGLTVELVALARRKIKTEAFDHYGVSRNFKLVRLPSLDFAPGNASAGYFWLRTGFFLLLAKIRLFFQHYDILYARELIFGLFFRDLILEIHSLPEPVKPWHRKAWRQAKKIIVLTSFLKERLIGEGIDGRKIVVAPDGVDLKDFKIDKSQEELRRELGLPLDKKIIMYAGSFYLHDWKGVDILLAAAKNLTPDCVLVLVGGEAEELAKIKSEEGANQVILVGRQPHQRVPRFLKASDLLILPNKKGDTNSEKYTSPLKLFEYMASGVPLIASDLPSLREILNGNNAILVEPNNAERLAETIRSSLNNEPARKKIAEQARFEVNNYTWLKRAEKITKFIEQ